jgi:hypothetical protein
MLKTASFWQVHGVRVLIRTANANANAKSMRLYADTKHMAKVWCAGSLAIQLYFRQHRSKTVLGNIIRIRSLRLRIQPKQIFLLTKYLCLPIKKIFITEFVIFLNLIFSLVYSNVCEKTRFYVNKNDSTASTLERFPLKNKKSGIQISPKNTGSATRGPGQLQSDYPVQLFTKF